MERPLQVVEWPLQVMERLDSQWQLELVAVRLVEQGGWRSTERLPWLAVERLMVAV